MNFSSLKNIAPIYLYYVSILSLVLAYIVRDSNIGFYYFLLIIGLVFFVLGFKKQLKRNK